MIVSACIEHAATAYGISAPAITSVMSASASAGSVGPMHIPPSWLPILARAGFPQSKVINDPCMNVAAGAWILAFQRWQSGGQDSDNQSKGDAVPGPQDKPSMPSKISASCIEDAAHEYKLSVTLLKGILATEGGTVGAVHHNANGSYDMGPAQINSSWLPKLEAAGYSRQEIINNGCLNIHVGAWILAQDMQGADPNRPAQFWKHVGDYNSATPYWNQRYVKMVWNNIDK